MFGRHFSMFSCYVDIISSTLSKLMLWFEYFWNSLQKEKNHAFLRRSLWIKSWILFLCNRKKGKKEMLDLFFFFWNLDWDFTVTKNVPENDWRGSSWNVKTTGIWCSMWLQILFFLLLMKWLFYIIIESSFFFFLSFLKVELLMTFTKGINRHLLLFCYYNFTKTQKIWPNWKWKEILLRNKLQEFWQ